MDQMHWKPNSFPVNCGSRECKVQALSVLALNKPLCSPCVWEKCGGDHRESAQPPVHDFKSGFRVWLNPITAPVPSFPIRGCIKPQFWVCPLIELSPEELLCHKWIILTLLLPSLALLPLCWCCRFLLSCFTLPCVPELILSSSSAFQSRLNPLEFLLLSRCSGIGT